MRAREFRAPSGVVRYWVSSRIEDAPELVFLPGLTADHRLFDLQVAHFEGRANCLAWDPPSHGTSRPFALTWSLDDLARLLHKILRIEGFVRPILVGQSMGGYVSQAFMDLFPGEAAGFVSIDSAPLQKRYFTRLELDALKHVRGMYAAIPWNLLLNWGSTGCATSDYGRELTRTMMRSYDKRDYVNLAAHGFRVLAEAAEADRPYEIDCPALLICGTKDQAGSARRYNRAWTKRAGIPLEWIEGAGHNANTDAPKAVNALIEEFATRVARESGQA